MTAVADQATPHGASETKPDVDLRGSEHEEAGLLSLPAKAEPEPAQDGVLASTSVSVPVPPIDFGGDEYALFGRRRRDAGSTLAIEACGRSAWGNYLNSSTERGRLPEDGRAVIACALRKVPPPDIVNAVARTLDDHAGKVERVLRDKNIHDYVTAEEFAGHFRSQVNWDVERTGLEWLARRHPDAAGVVCCLGWDGNPRARLSMLSTLCGFARYWYQRTRPKPRERALIQRRNLWLVEAPGWRPLASAVMSQFLTRFGADQSYSANLCDSFSNPEGGWTRPYLKIAEVLWPES